MTTSDTIFISIASYRDPQLVPTIRDCLAKATLPKRLRFGVCWQHGAETLAPEFREDARFRILDVDWRQSRGACWARAEAMKVWSGESWFLQIDSHCRFRAGWDELCVQALSTLAQPRAVLSTYATPFVPGGDEVLQNDPLQMAFQGFTPEGIPHMKPLAMRDEDDRRLRRARFLSAGFLFAPGSFVRDVPYDPELYFMGEEIAMTLRAYTSGYDLYHPGETIIWHDYVRADATKHWDDHVEGASTAKTWGEHDLHSKERVRRLLAGEKLGTFDLGDARSLSEYEAYAGISFRRRRVQDYTMASHEPPNPSAPPDWADHVYSWMVRIGLRAAELPVKTLGAAFWYIGVHDELGNEIYRRDFTAGEIGALPIGEREIVLVCELQSGAVPATWTVWPVSRDHCWMKKLQGRFGPDDFSIVVDD